jgi:hypothetical protein
MSPENENDKQPGKPKPQPPPPPDPVAHKPNVTYITKSFKGDSKRPPIKR